MSWVQQNLEWLVGFLIVGIIVLFFFPLLLGWQLNKEEEKNIYDRIFASKLTVFFKSVFKINEKEISYENFIKLAQS